MANELRDLHDNRRLARHAERLERLASCRRDGTMDVDAIGYDANAVARDSASLENGGNGSRDSDDRRGASVLPACPYIRAKREVDAARNDHRNARAERCHGGDRHCVRGVRVYNVDCAFSNRRPQPPGGSRIHLGRWAARDDLEPGCRRPFGQRLAAPRGNRRGVTAPRQLAGEPQRLALTTAPSSLSVDVHHAESHGAQHLPATVRTQGAE